MNQRARTHSTGRSSHGAVTALATIAALGGAVAVGGCDFDSSRLAERACTPGTTCSAGKVCCRGFCVLARTCVRDSGGTDSTRDMGPDLDPSIDRDLDGVADVDDNCPDAFNPQQQDADRDGPGDACDCAPTDSSFSTTVAAIDHFSDPAPLTPVDQAANWAVFDRVYRQSSATGLQRASHGLEEHSDFLALVALRLTGGGDDGLTFTPDKNRSMAGVVVRTSELGPGAGNGYYCGLDRENLRLVLGRTVGGDLGKNTIQLFADPFDEPGRPIGKPIRLDQSYGITLRVVGDQLSCRLLLPDRSRVEVTASDNQISSGGLALFTAGASALFEGLTVCATK